MSFFFRNFPFGIETNVEEEEDLEGKQKLKKERIRNINTTKYYELLELEKTASQDDIRKAFKKKIIKNHPDKGGDPELFRQINIAYETLSNEEKRKIYDKYGEEGVKESTEEENNINRNAKEKTKSVLYTMNVTLEDVYNGARKQLEVNRYRFCETCHGKGTNKKSVDAKCGSCKGQGVKVVVRQIAFGMFQQTVTCDDCGGEGTKIKDADKCGQCKGAKVIKKEKILDVDIEKGAPDKKRYVFQGESDEFPGALPGDVLVEIQIAKHNQFTRIGADLAFEAKISLYEALGGFEMVLKHLDGRNIRIKSRGGEIISHGHVKTVKDLGMPFYEQPQKFGNLYLKFTVIFPEKIETDHRSILHKILENQIKKEEEIGPDVKEKHFLTDFKKSEENTHHSGGRTEDRRHGEY